MEQIKNAQTNIDPLTLLLKNKIEIQYLDNDNKTQSLGYIYQPTIQDIVDCGGESIFAMYVSMFCFTKEILINEFGLKDIITKITEMDNIKLLDLFFLLSNDTEINNTTIQQYNYLLVKSLSLFFKTTNIKYSENGVGFTIDDKYTINRNNFDIVCFYIRQITNASIIEKEQTPQFKSDRQRDVYQKLMAGRNRKTKTKHISIKNMVDLLLIQNNFNYKEVLSKTYLQLIHDYQLSVLNIQSNTFQPVYTVDIIPNDKNNNDAYLLQNIKNIKI